MQRVRDMYEHQDWQVVHIRKPQIGNGTDKKTVNAALRNGQSVETHAKVSGAVREYSNRARKLEADVNIPATDEAPPSAPLSRLSPASCRELIKARTDQRITQAQLAQKCNEQPSVIKLLEGGGVMQNRSILAKVNKALGIHLRFDQ